MSKFCAVHEVAFDDYCPDCILNQRDSLLAVCQMIKTQVEPYARTISQIAVQDVFDMLDEVLDDIHDTAIARAKAEGRIWS